MDLAQFECLVVRNVGTSQVREMHYMCCPAEFTRIHLYLATDMRWLHMLSGLLMCHLRTFSLDNETINRLEYLLKSTPRTQKNY